MIHRVDILSIELQTHAATQDARILHDTIVEPFKSKVLAVIDTVLARFEIPEAINIGRIELRLSGADEASCLAALELQLFALITDQIAQAQKQPVYNLRPVEEGMDIVRFLELGFFSNTALQGKWERQEDPAYWQQLLLGQITTDFAVFLKHITVNGNAVARLLHYFPSSLDALKKMMGNPGMHTVATFIDSCHLLQLLLQQQFITAAEISSYLPDDTCRQLLQSLVLQAGSSAPDTSLLAVPEQLQEITDVNPTQYPRTIHALYELKQRMTLNGQWRQQESTLPVTTRPDKDAVHNGSGEWLAPAEALLPQGTPVVSDPLMPDSFLITTPDQLFTETAPATAMLFPAGALFVHAFLPAIFNDLGLLTARRFVNVAAQIKAVSVLQEIAGGTGSKISEKDLFLYKLLCGLDPGVFIKVLPVLSAAESDRITRHLELLIQEWQVLKNTSLTTVRANFLSRRAYVLQQDKELIVRMPSSVFDILLEQYPWNLSIIKLPWLPKIISLQLIPPNKE